MPELIQRLPTCSTHRWHSVDFGEGSSSRHITRDPPPLPLNPSFLDIHKPLPERMREASLIPYHGQHDILHLRLRTVTPAALPPDARSRDDDRCRAYAEDFAQCAGSRSREKLRHR